MGPTCVLSAPGGPHVGPINQGCIYEMKAADVILYLDWKYSILFWLIVAHNTWCHHPSHHHHYHHYTITIIITPSYPPITYPQIHTHTHTQLSMHWNGNLVIIFFCQSDDISISVLHCVHHFIFKSDWYKSARQIISRGLLFFTVKLKPSHATIESVQSIMRMGIVLAFLILLIQNQKHNFTTYAKILKSYHEWIPQVSTNGVQ